MSVLKYTFNITGRAALALIVGSALLYGQDKEAPKKSNQVTKLARGSAGELLGNIHLYHIFCNDADSAWTDAERNSTVQILRRGCAFIAGEAAKHDHEVRFTHEIGPQVDFKGYVPISHESDPIWTEQILEAMCEENDQASTDEWIENLKRKYDAQHVAFCIHVNKSALSYNLASYEGVDPRFQAERAICFARYPDGRSTAAATYAHELLHLFGAGDLYFPYDETAERKQRAKIMFPNDIMLRVDYNLSSLMIGPYTAYRIGWRDSLSAQLAVFND